VTIEQNAALFGGAGCVLAAPSRWVSARFWNAAGVCLLPPGAGKAEVIAKPSKAPITSMISATALQLHARCTVRTGRSGRQQAASRRLLPLDF